MNKIYCGDALTVLKTFPNEFVDCVITSPPYFGLRDYGVDGQIGKEDNASEYVNNLCNVFDEIKRTLKNTGTVWLNLGDSYKNKCLQQIPSRVAIEMTNRGWILRNEIIWYKRSCMPSPVKERFTVDFEKLYFFTKLKKYYFEQQLEPYAPSTIKRIEDFIKNDECFDPNKHKNTPGTQIPYEVLERICRSKSRIIESGRNKRCVWDISPARFRGAHFATFPKKLVETPIKAGSPEGGVVLDPFVGTGVTCMVAKDLGRKWIGIDLNPDYVKIAQDRVAGIM